MKHNCNDCKFINYGELSTYGENGKVESVKDYAECSKSRTRNSIRNSKFPFRATTCKCFFNFRGEK